MHVPATAIYLVGSQSLAKEVLVSRAQCFGPCEFATEAALSCMGTMASAAFTCSMLPGAYSMIALEGSTWQRHRRIVQRLLSPTHLATLSKTIATKCQIGCQLLAKALKSSGNDSIDVVPVRVRTRRVFIRVVQYLQRIVMDSSALSLIGQEFSTLSELDVGSTRPHARNALGALCLLCLANFGWF